jgi:hypothetical protein
MTLVVCLRSEACSDADPELREGRDGLLPVAGGLAVFHPSADLGCLVAGLLRGVTVDGVATGVAELIGDAEVDLPAPVRSAARGRSLALAASLRRDLGVRGLTCGLLHRLSRGDERR